ncbi:MAG: MBL fold metallo-hydrolase [Bacteroidales bacterium]
MIEIKTFYFNELRECCYIVWDQTKECVIIDPGCQTDNELGRLDTFMRDNLLKPVKILLTHGHFDHVMGLENVATKLDLPIYMHLNDMDQIKRAVQYCAMFGWEIKEITHEITGIKDGETITFGASKLKVLHTPGHTQGGVCFYNKEQKVLFSGDTLFEGSIGRTDHPGGNYDQLMDSIYKKLRGLPLDTQVLPGHGEPTTIGTELKSNPFLQPY